MGPKQSSPSAASAARLRAYSGSDLPSSTSTAAALRYSTANPAAAAAAAAAALGNQGRFGPDSGRPSSLFQPTIIPTGGPTHSHDEPDADAESGPRLLIGSLPAHLSPHLLGAGFHCPVCSKFVASDEMDLHIIMCLTKPRLTYNEDVLTKDSGECAICLDDMVQGDTIARLPCLCIYHKGCIDEWFEVNRSCPEHPTD